jgi:hypothetical protein
MTNAFAFINFTTDHVSLQHTPSPTVPPLSRGEFLKKKQLHKCSCEVKIEKAKLGKSEGKEDGN